MRTSKLLLLVAFLSGCGGSVAGSPNSDSGASDATTDGPVLEAGTDAPPSDGARPGDSGVPQDGPLGDAADDAPQDGGWSPICPAGLPMLGTACQVPQGVYCEYNQAWWNVSCSAIVGCLNGAWANGAPCTTPCFPEPGPNPGACPQNPTGISTTSPCPEAGITCNYDQGISCNCMPTGLPEAGDGWYCNPEPGCPPTRPRLGATCSSSPFCTYEAVGEECVNGTWQPVTTGHGC